MRPRRGCPTVLLAALLASHCPRGCPPGWREPRRRPGSLSRPDSRAVVVARPANVYALRLMLLKGLEPPLAELSHRSPDMRRLSHPSSNKTNNHSLDVPYAGCPILFVTD